MLPHVPVYLHGRFVAAMGGVGYQAFTNIEMCSTYKSKTYCRAEKDCIGTASPTSTPGPSSVLVIIYAVRVSVQPKHDGSRQSIQ